MQRQPLLIRWRVITVLALWVALTLFIRADASEAGRFRPMGGREKPPAERVALKELPTSADDHYYHGDDDDDDDDDDTPTPTVPPTATQVPATATKHPDPSPRPTQTPVPTATVTPRPAPTATATPALPRTPVARGLRFYLPFVLQGAAFCLSSEEEPNKTPSLADALPPLCPDLFVPGNLPGGDDDDWYRIRVGESGVLAADLIDIPPGTDYDLFLYASGAFAQPIAESRGYGPSPEHIDGVALQPGTYYLRVFPYSGRSDQHYRLRWQLR